MRVSRGGFLKICGAALLGPCVEASPLLAAAAGPAIASAIGRPRVRFHLQNASAALFRPHLNTTFSLHSADGTRHRVVLATVAEGPIDKHIEQFSLIFRAPTGAVLPDGTYAFQHPALGTFELFIVPIGAADVRRASYEACFSRHVGPRGEDTACQTHS